MRGTDANDDDVEENIYVCVCVCAYMCVREWVRAAVVAKRVGGLGIAPKRTAVQLRRPLTHVLCDRLMCVCPCARV